jgi:thiosulfate/3-mercaptopyruvate sulfurtransferase
MKKTTTFILGMLITIFLLGFTPRTATYFHSDVLVSTEWVAEHKNLPNLVLVEVDADIATYKDGHIPGAIGWSWQKQLSDTLRRDIISKADLEKLLSSSGIDNNSTIILYGDNNPAFLCRE